VSESAPLEVQRMVEARLARFAAVGTVLVEGELLSLQGQGPTASLPIGALLARWDGLSFTERERECALLAASLQRSRRPIVSPTSRQRSWSFGWLIGAGLVLAAGATYHRFKGAIGWSSASASRALPASPNTDQDAERRRHAAAVCSATRARVALGGTVSAADVEGWVVELALVAPAADQAWRGLDSFLMFRDGTHEGRIVWPGTPELARLEGSDTRVQVEDSSWPETAAQFRERRLTFSGNYVVPYFREHEQIQLVRLAHALAEQQAPSLGALYARCASDTEHHIGSWFWGTSPGGAAASLLFFMGSTASPAQLPREMLSSRQDRDLEPAFALSNLLSLTGRLKKPDLVALLGLQSGTVAGAGAATTLAFPFVESDRALLASHALARMFEPKAAAPPTTVRHKRNSH
jgi:hypothetical protein